MSRDEGALRELSQLRAENNSLRTRICELEDRLNYLGRHRTLARGIAGERLIADAVSGLLTPHTSAVDVNLPDGRTVEVKQAKVSAGNPARNVGRRWQWQKVFGETNQKMYDVLLLVGEADPAFQNSYLDPAAPYVLFCVPFAAVLPLTTAGTRGARGITLSTNPNRARGTSAALYISYQTTIEELHIRLVV
jgi:hypothetical protein